MADSRGSAEGAFILRPYDTQRLRLACPDLHHWPESWHVEPADIAVGQQIVQLLTPFLLHLLDQGLAKATVRRHRNNLWSLGGELIHCRYEDDDLARLDMKRRPPTAHRKRWRAADVATDYRIRAGLIESHLSQA